MSMPLVSITAASATPHRSASPDPRLARIAADVERRLRPTCDGMPAEAFAGLVGEIARRKLRWEKADG
jgi:hypothetical protein